MAAAEVIDVDDEHLIGSYSALLVAIWGARTLPEKVARFIVQAKEFVEHWPRIAMIVIVEPDSELPGKEARKRLEELTHVLIGKTVALVYVFEGTGFRAIATRTLMTGLMLVGPPSAKQHKIARTTEEAMDWLVPFLAGPEFGDEAERRNAVLELQQRFDDYRSARPEAVSVSS